MTDLRSWLAGTPRDPAVQPAPPDPVLAFVQARHAADARRPHPFRSTRARAVPPRTGDAVADFIARRNAVAGRRGGP